MNEIHRKIERFHDIQLSADARGYLLILVQGLEIPLKRNKVSLCCEANDELNVTFIFFTFLKCITEFCAQKVR